MSEFVAVVFFLAGLLVGFLIGFVVAGWPADPANRGNDRVEGDYHEDDGE